MKKKFFSFALAMIMTIVPLSTAYADSTGAVSDVEYSSVIGDKISNETIRLAEKYVILNDDGHFSIKNQKVLQKKLSAEQYEYVEATINSTNEMVAQIDMAKDSITIDQKNKTIIIESTISEENEVEVSNPDQTSISTMAVKEGVNKVELKWFGIRIYLSRTVVNHIINGSVSAGAVYLGVVFPGIGYAIAIAIATFLITEFATGYIARAMYVDIGLKFGGITGIPIGIRGFGFQ